MKDPSCVRVDGPLAPYADGFRIELVRQGYSPWTAVLHLQLMGHLSRWLAGQGIGGSVVTPELVRVFLTERRAAGYANLRSGQGLAPLLELKRLYVTRAFHGRRVAQALMEAALELARTRGAKTMWLGVWERNPRAVAFYAKYGFARVGEHTFMLGGDAQTDWLLARSV